MKPERILAVVDGKDDGEVVLRKTRVIASHSNAAVHVIRVIHEGFVDLSVLDDEKSAELHDYLMAASKDWLEELVAPLDWVTNRLTVEVIWFKSAWQAILNAATSFNADVIIKGTHSREGVSVRTPEDWHLLRNTTMPVMLLKALAWREHPVVLAAVDIETEDQAALNARILTRGAELARCIGGELHTVTVFPAVEHWVGPVTLAIDFDKTRAQIRTQFAERLNTLAAGLNVDVAKAHAVEGRPEVAISSLISTLKAEVTVLGTVQRRGPGGLLIGNTSEKILNEADCDVEVLR
ncbi:MAG: universal stress protein [Pseudomonadota bacterium]